MTRKQFIETVENAKPLEGVFDNLVVSEYYEKRDKLSKTTEHFAIVSDHNSDEPEKFWRVVYKYHTMEEVGCTFVKYTLREARQKLAELMIGIY